MELINLKKKLSNAEKQRDSYRLHRITISQICS